MALTGIEIYKHLPKTNCKDCGFPTCLAFAMRLAQKTADLSACPHVSEAAKEALDAAARPPIRLVTVGQGDKKVEVGNEVVLFRHEKTFYHPPGFMVRIGKDHSNEEVTALVKAVSGYQVERVGRELRLDGFAIQDGTGDKAAFVQRVELVKSQTDLPLVLMSFDPEAMEAALAIAGSSRPLIYGATKDNALKMAELAKKYSCPLAIYEPGGLDALTELAQTVNSAGVEDIVLDPGARGLTGSLASLTQLRRLALKKNFRPLGYPVITFPGEAVASQEEEALAAGMQVAKYAGIVVLDRFSPELVYPLLTLRMNIYTDPQKPIQVTPGLYPIGSPKETSPLMITSNFSLTYFTVAGEIESSGFPSWLLVADTEGLSVLTGWAAGKFDAERIAKTARDFNAENQVSHRSLIIPGAVAVLQGELEEELKGWRIMVGPREAVDIGSFLRQRWV